MLYEKKSSVWQNFVRSDKISNSVRPMSDKTLEYFDSTDMVNQNTPPPNLSGWMHKIFYEKWYDIVVNLKQAQLFRGSPLFCDLTVLWLTSCCQSQTHRKVWQFWGGPAFCGCCILGVHVWNEDIKITCMYMYHSTFTNNVLLKLVLKVLLSTAELKILLYKVKFKKFYNSFKL